MKLKTLRKAFEDFFFKPMPLHTAAALRIGFGLLLLFNWLTVYPFRHIFYGDNGLVSFATAEVVSNVTRFNLFGLLPHNDTGLWILCAIHLLAALGMIFGFLTRISTALSYLVLFTLHERNVFILNSADILLTNMLFLMIFTGAGKLASLDQKLFYKGKDPGSEAPWALRLIQIQFCVVYLSTVLFKMKGEPWVDGTAIYIATRLDDLVRVPMPWLLDHMLVIKLMTWGTLAVELSLATLVWIKELRYWVLAAGLLLHLGIEVLMNIPMFEYIMIISMLSMVDPEDLKQALNAAKLKWKAFAERRRAYESA